MESNSQSVLIAWEKLSLGSSAFIPQLVDFIKTALMQDLLIVFNFGSSDSERILAFDLNEKQWLKVKLKGEKFYLGPGSSVSMYDENTIVLLGTRENKQEGILSILSFEKDSNEINVYHEAISVQDRLVKFLHTANIVGQNMYIYGGSVDGKVVQKELCYIDLKTLKVTRFCNQSGLVPDGLYGHHSVTVKNKIYIYGGFVDINENQNQSVYILDTATFKWERLTAWSKPYGTAQVYQDNIYFFGGIFGISHNFLSIYNTSKNFWYEVSKKGDAPKASKDFLSAIYENKMIVIQQNTKNFDDIKQMHSFSLDMKSVKDPIGEITLRRAIGTEQNNRDIESLKAVQDLIKEQKEHDIIFIVQEKRIPAHKEILTLRSSYFSNMFSSGMQESNQKEIIISDISPEAFEALTEYLYKGILPFEDSVIKELLQYSEKILLKRLRLHCEMTLVDSIKKENVLELYKLSTMSGNQDLQEACLQFMTKNIHYFAEEFSRNASNLDEPLHDNKERPLFINNILLNKEEKPLFSDLMSMSHKKTEEESKEKDTEKGSLFSSQTEKNVGESLFKNVGNSGFMKQAGHQLKHDSQHLFKESVGSTLQFSLDDEYKKKRSDLLSNKPAEPLFKAQGGSLFSSQGSSLFSGSSKQTNLFGQTSMDNPFKLGGNNAAKDQKEQKGDDEGQE